MRSMWKRKSLVTLSLLIFTACCVLGSSEASATDDDRDERYVYPITVESENWFEYSVIEKNEMLRIEDDILLNMSDEQLVRAIADYPYLVDIYVSDNIESGLDQFAENCDAYRELLRRESGRESLRKYVNMILEEMKTEPRTDGRTEFVSFALQEVARLL